MNYKKIKASTYPHTPPHKAESQEKMNYREIKVSTALICYREKDKLALILRDLKNQSVFEQIGEVLLFQNGNCKQTRKTAESFLDQLPLKIFSSPDNNLGQARAILTQKSRYNLITWTDSDCRLPKNWLEELIKNWQSQAGKNTLAVGGPNRLPEEKIWQKMINLSLSHPLGHGWSPQAWKVKKPKKVSHIPTTNGLFLKKGILSAGNFSDKRKLTGEDLGLGFRLKKQGDLILFPGPLVINNYANSYFESLKRLFFFGTIQFHHKSLQFYVGALFAPGLVGSLILGLFQGWFLLFPTAYFFLLFLAGCQVALQNRQTKALLLPLFWLIQHFFYSAGMIFGAVRAIKLVF